MGALRDFLCFPLRAFILDEKAQKTLGLTTLEEERLNAVRPLLRGRIIDIGCGANQLVRSYRNAGGDAIGVDVFDSGADIVANTSALPFGDGEFDTAVMMACINHVPGNMRQAVLREAARVLRPGGRLLATMIGPIIGWFCHKLVWWDPDQRERGMSEGEAYGLDPAEVKRLAEGAGFALEKEKGFVYGLNRLFVFVKK